MLRLLLFCVAMVTGGVATTALALGTRPKDASGDARPEWHPGPWEYAATTSLAALALAVAIGWALLLGGVFGGRGLLGGAAAVFLLSAAAIVHTLSGRNLTVPRSLRSGSGLVVASAILVVAAWMAVTAWAACVVYFQNNDGLGYHMPRAALLAQAGVFRVFDLFDERATWPIDFELLCAETIALANTDRLASLVPMFGYAVLLLQTAALVERWWGRGLHVPAVTLVVAAMPIALLHACTHKNDTFECAMALAALRLASAWTATRARWLALASAAAAALALGMKVNGGAVVLATGSIFCAGAVVHHRKGLRPSLRDLAIFALAVVGFVLLLGGWSYLYNLATIKKPFLDLHLDPPMTWGHFSNLWRFFYVSMVAPYTTGVSGGRVTVPWSDRPWYMGATDPFFSNFGVVMPLLVAALPIAAFRYRGKAATGAFERAMTVVPCVAIGALIVCFDMKPVGFYVGSTRFLLFLPPLLAGFTLAPLLRELAERMPRAAVAVVGAAASLFASEAHAYGYRSSDGILRLAAEVRARPELSRAGPQVRAGFVVDRSAGPTDVVAIDAGYDAFPYPAYGKALRRQVRYIHLEPGPPVIDDDVRWVIVDRPWHCFFGSPEFRDFGDWGHAFGRGRPTAEDRRVFDAMSSDPRFKLVWRNERANQAVFLRAATP